MLDHEGWHLDLLLFSARPVKNYRMRWRMVGETMFAQIIHEAPSASRKKPSLLAVCCMCALVRDETGYSIDHERWVTRRTYRKTHGAMPDDCVLTHTYCPNCFTQVMDRMGTG